MLLQMMASAPPDTVKQTIEEAKAHMPNFPPYERARLQLLIAQLQHAPLSQRTTDVEALLKVAPNDLDLSMIGSVRFLNGDVNGGIEMLNKAVKLNPGNTNLKAQLAQGLVQSRRFADAEKLLATFDKNPAAQAELAQTILLEGDVKRATATLEKFAVGCRMPIFRLWCALRGRSCAATKQGSGACRRHQVFEPPTDQHGDERSDGLASHGERLCPRAKDCRLCFEAGRSSNRCCQLAVSDGDFITAGLA